MKKVAVIIGAGPAGLTAAYELLSRTAIHPIVVESDASYVGGISRTVNYKGNRIDIGGHRFFSKSDRVMRWWSEVLPVRTDATRQEVTYQRSSRALTEGMRVAAGGEGVRVMEVRPRKTRIVYNHKFFAYPVELSFDTLRKLGIRKVMKIGATYIAATLFPRPEQTLEDFFVNRFGSELYKTFFKSYTEKVWGAPCHELSAEWGVQRVKGLSIMRAVLHAGRKMARIGPLSGKGVETSLIEQFLYPTMGPGLMWEAVAEAVQKKGGEVRMGTTAVRVCGGGSYVEHVVVRDRAGREEAIACDYVFSTADLKTLMQLLDPSAPEEVLAVSHGLQYRDFLTVGLLLAQKPVESDQSLITDTWMYVHEKELRVGRIQLFHNWHPNLVAHPAHGWVGLEYFCTEGDDLWRMPDDELIAFATGELARLGFVSQDAVIDGTVIRQPKAYPSYLGSYARFEVIQHFLDGIENLFPIGRNGMHRYNNQDHSMLAAMTAVDNLLAGRTDKSNLWHINTEQEYHEEKKAV